MALEVPPRGKEKLLALGTYPDVGLKLARERRDEARSLLPEHIDPGAHRKAAKAARAGSAANSFEAVALEWLARQSREWVPRHAVRVKRLFERDLFPWLGSMSIAEIAAVDLLAALRRTDGRGPMTRLIAPASRSG